MPYSCFRAAALLIASGAAAPALAASFDYTVLAREGQVFAGRTVGSTEPGPRVVTLNNAGQFTFQAGTEESRAVYLGELDNPGTASVLLATDESYDSVMPIEIGLLRMNQSGQVAFTFDADGDIPVDDYNTTVATDAGLIAKYGDAIAGYTYAGTVSDGVDINNSGTVAHFLKTPIPNPIPEDFNFSSQEVLLIGGVHAKRGGAGNDTLAGQSFYGFHQDSKVDLNDGGAYLVNFWKTAAFDDAVAYVDGDVETLVAVQGQAFTAAGAQAGEIIDSVGSSFALNNAGDVAYVAYVTSDTSDRSVIVLNNEVVATDGTVVDGFAFTDLEGNVFLNEAGQIAYGFSFAYGGDDWGGEGIVLDGEVIAYSGMLIDGERVVGVFSETMGLNDLGQMVLGVEFEDGSTAIVSSVVPEPASAALVATGLLLLARRCGPA